MGSEAVSFPGIDDPKPVGTGKDTHIQKALAAIDTGRWCRARHHRIPSLWCEFGLKQPFGL